MSHKHTPGPWETIPEEGLIVSRAANIPTHEFVVAAIYPANREANARLIAAAPDLLEALEVAFQRSCERSESRVRWTVRDQTAHETIKAAIVKATGAV